MGTSRHRVIIGSGAICLSCEVLAATTGGGTCLSPQCAPHRQAVEDGSDQVPPPAPGPVGGAVVVTITSTSAVTTVLGGQGV